MASIYYLNQNPHVFWDFVSNLESHPFFAQYARPPPYTTGEGTSNQEQERPRDEPPSGQPETPQAEAEGTSSAQHPETAGTRGLGDNAGGQGSGRGRRGRHCGRGNHRGGPQDFDGQGRPFGRFPGDFGRGRGGGFHRHRGGHRGWGPRFGRPRENFDVPAFLRDMASVVGIDVDQLLRSRLSQNEDVDFVPHADIFDAPNEFIVHISLPGAKRPDISVDYDAEHSVLRLAGVVYRPGITEEMTSALALDERAREVGVFEREVRLGNRAQPAHVDIDKISAKLLDGILIVTLPKVVVDPENLKKKVPIETESENGNAAGEKSNTVGEKSSEKQPVAESNAMHIDSETEKGDGDDDGQRTPSRESDFSDNEEEGKEYVKVDVE